MTTIEDAARTRHSAGDRRHRPPRPPPRGRPPHRGPGQLPRRHHAARHAAHGDPAVAGGARPAGEHRHVGGRRARRRRRRRHRRADGPARPGLDADAVGRHAGGARHRQGALPGPGGRRRRRDRPLHRRGRARAHRRRLRVAAADHDAAAGARRGRGPDPRREGGPDRQPGLRVGERRRGGDRSGVRQRPTGSCRSRPTTPARTPRRSRRAGSSPTSTRSPGRPRSSSPRRRPTPTARCSPWWPGCPSRTSASSAPTSAAGSATRCRSTRATSWPPPPRCSSAAGEVGRDPQREPDLHRLRPRLPHEGRAGPQQRRPDPGAARRHALATRARSTPTRSRRKFKRRAVPRRDRQLRLPGRPRRCARARSPTRRRAAWPTAARSASPRRRSSSSGSCRPPPTSSGIDPADFRFKNFIQPEQFPYEHADRLRVRLGRLPDGAAQGARRGRLRAAAGRAGGSAGGRAGSSASASPTSPRRSAPARRRPTTSPG